MPVKNQKLQHYVNFVKKRKDSFQYSNFYSGYVGVVTATSPILALEPGITNANTLVVYVDVDEDIEENKNPKQSLEETENIQVLTVPIKDLYSKLLEFDKMGSIVDAKLYTFAYALKLGQLVSK